MSNGWDPDNPEHQKFAERFKQFQTAAKVFDIDVSEKSHAVYDFLQGLDRDELQALRDLITSVITMPDYWLGYIAAQLSTHYDICPAHGVDHAPLEETEPYEETEAL